MAALTIGLGFFTQQHEFPKIIGFYAPFFLLYLLVVTDSSFIIHHSSLKFWLSVALLLRLLLVFSEPGLSNDVYRFIWDGRLLVQGYNPFDHLPMYYLENQVPVEGIDRALFEAFDAKNTYTVYPPVAQAQFASA
jgi:alpha-1,6-mannosyltransferase